MPWYLGRPGALVQLPAPSRGTQVPFGGGGATHQLLSGGQVVDRFAVKRSWQFSWQALTRDQVGVLDAFVYGATGPGPYVLLDPEQRNLLPLNVSTGTDTTDDTTGFTAGTHSSLFSSTNAAANFNSIGGPFPTNGTRTLGIGITTSVAAFEAVATVVKSVPVLPSTSYTFSIYANVPSAATFAIAPRVAWYDSSNAFISFSTHTSVAANTAARAQADGATSPANAATAQLLVVPTATNTSGATQFVYVDGLQFEQATAASAWVPGLDVPNVSVAPGGGRARQQTNQNDYNLTLIEL